MLPSTNLLRSIHSVRFFFSNFMLAYLEVILKTYSYVCFELLNIAFLLVNFLSLNLVKIFLFQIFKSQNQYEIMIKKDYLS